MSDQHMANLINGLESLRRQIEERDEEIATLRGTLAEAFKRFCLTQRPEYYPEDHWSRRAQQLLADATLALSRPELGSGK